MLQIYYRWPFIQCVRISKVSLLQRDKKTREDMFKLKQLPTQLAGCR